MNKLHVLHEELKLKQFSQLYLCNCLQSDVKFYSVLLYIDEFSLYRNMYWVLCEIYLTLTSLTIQERQSISNVYSITLDSHRAALNAVIEQIQHRFIILKWECQLHIKGNEIMIWVSIITFTEDMKQQQASAEFIRAYINLSCQMCFADSINWDDMSLDVVWLSHYHHMTADAQRRIDALSLMTEWKKAWQVNEMTFKMSALQLMMSALDLIHSRSEDFTHSEYTEVIQCMTETLCSKILTNKALRKFTDLFWAFFFSAD